MSQVNSSKKTQKVCDSYCSKVHFDKFWGLCIQHSPAKYPNTKKRAFCLQQVVYRVLVALPKSLKTDLKL